MGKTRVYVCSCGAKLVSQLKSYLPKHRQLCKECSDKKEAQRRDERGRKIDELRASYDQREAEREANNFGVVYILESENGMTKIGMSTTDGLSHRIAGIQSSSPVTIKLAGYFKVPKTDNTRRTEFSMQCQVDGECIRGEWYRVNPGYLEKLIERYPGLEWVPA